MQGALAGVTEQQALANVAHIAAPTPAPAAAGGWNTPPPQAAPVQQQPAQQPQGPSLPASLSKYNNLVPGLPTQPCAQCGQTAYPCSFQSKAGKTFSKYKCGVDDKSHENPWI